MKVDIGRDADFGIGSYISVWIPTREMPKDVELVTYVSAPVAIVLNLDNWNGEHLVFDADDFEYDEDEDMESCEGEISDELARVWMRQLETWFAMRPQPDSKMEELGYIMLHPMESMLGVAHGSTMKHIAEYKMQYA